MAQKNQKALVVYFSHKGENYVSGKIVSLQVGNTAVAAKTIASLTEADIFEIQTVEAYPSAYHACTAAAKEELHANARPALTADIDITEYNAILLGYPNWWGTMPMPVWTFLEQHSFSGKKIFPFCTHEGGAMGQSKTDLERLVPDAIVYDGLAIKGSHVSDASSAIIAWLKQNEIIV